MSIVVHTQQGLEGKGSFPSHELRVGQAIIDMSRTNYFPFGLAKQEVHRELQSNPFIEKLLKLVCSLLCLHSCASL